MPQTPYDAVRTALCKPPSDMENWSRPYLTIRDPWLSEPVREFAQRGGVSRGSGGMYDAVMVPLGAGSCCPWRHSSPITTSAQIRCSIWEHAVGGPLHLYRTLPYGRLVRSLTAIPGSAFRSAMSLSTAKSRRGSLHRV